MPSLLLVLPTHAAEPLTQFVSCSNGCASSVVAVQPVVNELMHPPGRDKPNAARRPQTKEVHRVAARPSAETRESAG